MHRNCSSNDTIKWVKRQATVWEKIFVIYQSGKKLLFGMYKELLQIKKKKGRQTNRNTWAKELNRHLTKEGIQISNKLIRGCSTSLVITEMQNRTTAKYWYTLLWLKIKWMNNTNSVRMWNNWNSHTLLVEV